MFLMAISCKEDPMARVNGTPVTCRLDSYEFLVRLLDASPQKDGKGVRITLTVQEEGDLFQEHDTLEVWFTERLHTLLQDRGLPTEGVEFKREAGGIYQS